MRIHMGTIKNGVRLHTVKNRIKDTIPRVSFADHGYNKTGKRIIGTPTSGGDTPYHLSDGEDVDDGNKRNTCPTMGQQEGD